VVHDADLGEPLLSARMYKKDDRNFAGDGIDASEECIKFIRGINV
jgi:hypothetical protein